jgi:6-pyruvoyltetrahydropterin/6-carboxytetrahydropterin synthase
MPSRDYCISVERKIDTGHRVLGHEGKCRFLHGHTYTITVDLTSSELFPIGFVVDFGDVKEMIDRWDHKFLLWDMDPLVVGIESGLAVREMDDEATAGIVRVPFNPTAENMAESLARRFVGSSPGFDNIEKAVVEVSETESTVATYSAYR